jgi:hypothetical protein
VQLAPPLAGAGLVHVRVWLRVPPPHVAVHVVLLTHPDQLPSTAELPAFKNLTWVRKLPKPVQTVWKFAPIEV